ARPAPAVAEGRERAGRAALIRSGPGPAPPGSPGTRGAQGITAAEAGKDAIRAGCPAPGGRAPVRVIGRPDERRSPCPLAPGPARPAPRARPAAPPPGRPDDRARAVLGDLGGRDRRRSGRAAAGRRRGAAAAARPPHRPL